VTVKNKKILKKYVGVQIYKHCQQLRYFNTYLNNLNHNKSYLYGALQEVKKHYTIHYIVVFLYKSKILQKLIIGWVLHNDFLTLISTCI